MENSMNLNKLSYCFALILAGAIGAANADAQIPADVEAHLKAAREAAKFEWVGTLSRNCVAPELGPPEIGTRGAIPDRSLWYAEPAKVFDNLYFLGTRFHSSWALTTSDGIILIDTLYNYASEPEIVDGLKTLGLDPTTVKYVLITHGHGDHDEGAKLLQDRYGAHVALAAGDWDLIEKAKFMAGGKPKRDIVVTDGQKITLGDTTLTAVLTPGHTPGAYGLIFQVKDHGRPLTVAYASGTAFSFPYDAPHFDTFISSQKKMAAAAAAAGATIVISNHSAFDNALTRVKLVSARKPGEPHPYEVGAAAVADYFTVLEECALAAEAGIPK
jgi:metallo-beta-lactamase class B